MNSGNDDEGWSLWQEVIRTIRPLIGRSTHRPPPSSVKSSSGGLSTASGAQFVPPRPDRQGRDLDRRTAEKLRLGKMKIDARLDLHGMTQAQAQPALAQFITHSYDRGLRCLLVITGKGRSAADADDGPYIMQSSGPSGILRQRVPEWLGHDNRILRIEPAQPQHGGGGALYVLLRRHRDSG